MATQHSRSVARLMMAPAVVLLLGWMLVPLTMTLFFSFKKTLALMFMCRLYKADYCQSVL